MPAHVAFETVTPTGAAILRTVADGYGPLPAMTVEGIGHGAGNDREAPMPNVLRAVLGRESGWSSDRVVQLEAHLDDQIPEHFDHLMERLFEAGALDVSLHPLQMKKNRPGFELRVLAPPARRDVLARVVLSETSTLGLRVSERDRLVLPRDSVRVETPEGRIDVKVVRRPDGRIDVSAEYDDCKRVARRSGAPLREVARRAEELARAQLGD